MTHQEALRALVKIHKEIEDLTGCDPNWVTPDVVPLDSQGGFDSPLIPTAIRMVARELGVSLPRGGRLRNPYISADRRRRLTLREVAARFCELYGKENRAA